MNGHEVLYTIPKGVKVLDLKYRRTSFPTEHIGHFSADDAALNVLWEKSLNTMDINMRDAIQDPDRERAQWWGDVVTLLGEILYTCDTNGHKAVFKAISNLVEWQKPDSVLFSPVPAGEWEGELPTQMLAAVSQYGFWTYFQYTADTATIRYVYPHVKKYLALWQLDSSGLVVHRSGGWNWHDWGFNIDEKVIENAWYYMALDGAKRMAGLIGETGDAEAYERIRQKIKESFNRQLWNGSAYRSPAYTGQTDDRGHGLAVVAGLADSAQYRAIEKVFAESFHAGPYLEKYVLEALFLMNKPEQAVQRMKERYREMIESRYTTLWEGWSIGSSVFGGGTYNHGWSGGPLTLMHQYMAGLAPVQAGYKTFSVRPQMGGVSRIRCQTPTPFGFVSIDVVRDAKSVTLSLAAPKQTAGLISVPKPASSAASNIRVNGKLVVQGGRQVRKVAGLKYEGENENYDLFSIAPGNWRFVSSME